MSTDLAIVEQDALAPIALFDSTDPDVIVAEASRHAKALASVIEDRGLYKQIGPSKHILVEGWQTLGAMLRTFAVSEGEPEFVEIDGVAGFKATVCAMRDGEVIGRATSFCMRDENTWKNRPLHALSGMAQTRATSRALKGPLGFIVKLAGYSATPAEEMPQEAEFTPVAEASQFAPPPAAQSKTISEAQVKKLWATWRTNKQDRSDTVLQSLIKTITGQEHTNGIPKDKFDAVLAAITDDDLPF